MFSTRVVVERGRVFVRQDFQSWLRRVPPISPAAQHDAVSRCRRVEKWEGDLDRHFAGDRMGRLLGRLSYSREDEKAGLHPRHSVPFSTGANVRQGTNSLASAVRLYFGFCEDSGREPSSSGHERSVAASPMPGKAAGTLPAWGSDYELTSAETRVADQNLDTVLTKRDLAKKFAGRARTWERAYQHPGSEALGKSYLVFLNPRLLSDDEFWKILNVGDSVWTQILRTAFSLSTLLCFREDRWNAVQLNDVLEVFAGQKHLMVRLGDDEVFPIGSRNVGGAVERIDAACPVADLTFDHVMPLEKILREKDRPGLRWLSGVVWDTAVAESNEKDPQKGDWCKGKDGKRYPPKEWLGAKKLKKPVMANLRQYSFSENGPHLQLQSEVTDIFACSTELMLRSSNSSRGTKVYTLDE